MLKLFEDRQWKCNKNLLVPSEGNHHIHVLGFVQPVFLRFEGTIFSCNGTKTIFWCIKTIFSCNGTLYEQLDGVSMGSSLGPALANIILSEFENIIVTELVNSGVIKFYRRYVDDTLLLIRPSDIQFVLDKFKSFDKNLVYLQ